MVWYGLNPTNSVVAPLEATIWGEPELAPHLRDARQFCLSVYILSYVLPLLFDPTKMAAGRDSAIFSAESFI